MKNPEQYIKRNIQTLLAVREKPETFGASYVQRTCQIGYNQAINTIETMLADGTIARSAEREYHYVFIKGRAAECTSA